MPIEDDARLCLIAAIKNDTNRIVRPDQFGTLTPAAIGYQDGAKWLLTLRGAATCLRAKGHTVGNPTRAKANGLLSKVLDHSHAYLISLVSRSRSRRFSLENTGADGGGSDATQVTKLLTDAIDAVASQAGKAVDGRTTPLFFPNGIELILVEFKIGSAPGITLRISGGTCCKEAEEPGSNGNRLEAGQDAEVAPI